MSRHARPDTETTVREVWGLRTPDGEVLVEGYSCRPLTSAADAVGDFTAGIGEPILLKRIETTTITYRQETT